MTEEKRFDEKILEQIQGSPKHRVPITFPDHVLKEFSEYAKTNAADCYWLAIKQLLDFKREQTEGDLKSVILLQQIQDIRETLDVFDARLLTIEKPEMKKFQTFGTPEEKK